jgi:subtilisin family serine protease
MAPPALWDGACEAGDQFPSSTCTNKLIGARYFVDGFGRDNLSQGDYLSPRDEVGHGTHVASNAVGDAGVDPRVDGNPLGVDRITGVAPGAHLAVYKACWEMGYCSNVDVISAIDAAVRDGVDVINISLGGPHDPSRVDPTEAATLNADAAGVFVAVAAGNAGDYPDAISSPATAPWTTAVAATTASRTFRSTLHISAGGQSADLPASATWSGFSGVPLLDARSVAPDYQGNSFDDPRFCVAGLTREQVQGKVVVCEAFAPTEVLVDALRPLGAKGVVLVGGDGLDDPIVHSALPMAVVERHELAALRAVTDAGGGTAQLSASAARAIGWTADRVAGFSSRGPASTTADLLRPDVAAPGVNVLAAYAPNTFEATNGWEAHSLFAVLSGTSMASPQVAGAGALLTELHPTWTPAQMRSALVTTARPTTDGDGPASPLAAGAGRIDPTAAADPGLVLAPSTAEYRAFADGTLAPRDLDLPSIQLGDVEGPVSVTRTVTSVASTRASWTVSVEGGDFSSLDAQVSPRRFTIAPGQSQALSIDLTDAEGARDYRPLSIVLRNGQDGRTVRLPVAMHDPGVTGAPETIKVDGAPADGEQAVSATVAGTVHPVAYGLAAPEVRRGLQTTAPDFPDLQEYTLPVTLDKPTPLLAAKATATDGTALAAGIYRDVDGDGRYTVTDQNDRLSPTSPDPAEWNEADATRLPAGKYLVSVWVPEPHDASVPFDLRTWTVDDPQPDDPRPAPGLVAGGDVDRVWPAAPHSFPLRWNGVTGTESLRGLVEWDGAGDGNVLDTSVVRLTPGA